MSDKDVNLAFSLATGMSVAAAAEKVELSERTAYRRLEDASFRRLVISIRDDFMSRAAGELGKNLTRAVEVLAESMASPNENLRIRAARTMVTLGLKVRENVDMAERMRYLEEMFESRSAE